MLTCICMSNAQDNIPKAFEFPREELYLHLNTNHVFSGETLYYKIYTTTKNLLSEYSKIAYLRLISPEKKTIIEQKIRLSKGQGYSDFLVSTTIPTGNYKLIAYTKLGLKQSVNNIFAADISILNPYVQLNPKFVLILEKSLELSKASYISDLESDIKIKLSDSVFGQRKKVEMKILTGNESKHGNYSVSVRKIDDFQFSKTSSILKHDLYQKTASLREESDFLPDLRGELISGKISSANAEVSVQNQSIALLIPDENFKLKLGKTDDDGRFYFNFPNSYYSKKAFIQVLNAPDDEFNITFNETPEPDLTSLLFTRLELHKSIKEQIVSRSIKNQINNSYSAVKRNSLKNNGMESFFGHKGVIYNLDDYTRFPDLNQTLVEIVKGVSFQKNKNTFDIKIRANDYNFQSPLKAMVLVDGLLIKDHSLLYNFDASKIQAIRVIKDKYYYGGNVFQGVLLIETIEKSYEYFTQLLDIKSIEIQNPEQEKIYHKVLYNAEQDLRHIPDFRTQLYWKPDLNIFSRESQLDFYTSDESGVYQITVEGISIKGEKIRTTKTFKVM